MFRRISQIGIKISAADLISGFQGFLAGEDADFSRALSGYLASKYAYMTSSGTAAFYIILQALKKCSRKEVMLPAYTAPSLVLPVLKAGLKPVLCDISMRDFNIDLNLLSDSVSEKTLCIVPTHMFGITVSGIEGLKQKMEDVFVIEDCAQSFGSKIGKRNTGSFSDVAFSSFNRGKNLPTYGGGCIFTESRELAGVIKTEVDKLSGKGLLFELTAPLKISALSMAARPWIYGSLYPIIHRFKDNDVPRDFSVGKYGNFQAGVGSSLLKRIDELSLRRYKNGMELIKGLAHIEEIIMPAISVGTKPAFNRLPVVFKDPMARKTAEDAFWRSGFDTSRMYLRPLHHIFDLGYKKDDFPNATYFAERLMTLPTHPLVTSEVIKKMIGILKGVLT